MSDGKRQQAVAVKCRKNVQCLLETGDRSNSSESSNSASSDERKNRMGVEKVISNVGCYSLGTDSEWQKHGKAQVISEKIKTNHVEWAPGERTVKKSTKVDSVKHLSQPEAVKPRAKNRSSTGSSADNRKSITMDSDQLPQTSLTSASEAKINSKLKPDVEKPVEVGDGKVKETLEDMEMFLKQLKANKQASLHKKL
jgi:hypothetical protein